MSKWKIPDDDEDSDAGEWCADDSERNCENVDNLDAVELFFSF